MGCVSTKIVKNESFNFFEVIEKYDIFASKNNNFLYEWTTFNLQIYRAGTVRCYMANNNVVNSVQQR